MYWVIFFWLSTNHYVKKCWQMNRNNTYYKKDEICRRFHFRHVCNPRSLKLIKCGFICGNIECHLFRWIICKIYYSNEQIVVYDFQILSPDHGLMEFFTKLVHRFTCEHFFLSKHSSVKKRKALWVQKRNYDLLLIRMYCKVAWTDNSYKTLNHTPSSQKENLNLPTYHHNYARSSSRIFL